MAAATATSPLSSPTGPVVHRKPVALEDITADRGLNWSPNVDALVSPRLRQPAAAPVKVSLQSATWAPQPSNANIESSQSSPGIVYGAGNASQEATIRSVDAPLPPLPSSRDGTQGWSDNRTGKMLDDNAARGQTPVLDVFREEDLADLALLADMGSMKLGTDMATSPPIPDTSPHAGLDFGFTPSAAAQAPGLAERTAERSVESPVVDSRPAVAALGRLQEEYRHSRETDTSSSIIHQPASTESSATTSASSVSGINEVPDLAEGPGDASTESSILEDQLPHNNSVPQLQYHHQSFLPRGSSIPVPDPKTQSTPDLVEAADGGINRHLTPTIYFGRRSSLPRPHSAYSAFSDRGRSPGQNRTPSAQSARKSPDQRPSSYAELLNVPYPQPAPAPLTIDNSQLRNAVGSNASLLSAQKTLEMYRQNVKKTNDMSIQYSFAVFLIATAQEQGLNLDEARKKSTPKPVRDHDSPYIESPESSSSPLDLVREARSILQKLANNGYPFAQYYLADGFASGLFSKGREDYNSAFPLFVLAAKHGHAESAFRTALCYEFGWGCRKDPAKAVQFLRIAASKRHPGAMTRLGRACLLGDLGEKRYREGLKWLKLATESADNMYNAAPYHLGVLYETGYGDDIFQDEGYAAELFTQAAELGNAEAAYRMGDAYEHGKLNCPRDPALSVHFYTGAAERGHAGAMMGLCAWYMVGAEPILEKDEEEAYEWARRSAELGFVKAQYAVGYFTEMGIGCRKDILEANVWYVQAADAGDERARQRLAVIQAAISGGGASAAGQARSRKGGKPGDKDDKECIVM